MRVHFFPALLSDHPSYRQEFGIRAGTLEREHKDPFTNPVPTEAQDELRALR